MPLVIISSFLLAAGLYITWLVHNRSRLDLVVEPWSSQLGPPQAEKSPLISVIIPARNEERNIRRCVEALFSQSYSNFELIVVDDRSSDETGEILSQLQRLDTRLHLVVGQEMPPGWAGKPHALVQGVNMAQGEWLCFMDADTFAGDDLLASTYKKAIEQNADMLSILTEQELVTFWEKTILPLVFLGLSFGFPPQRVNDPCKPDAISNGQFILVKRRVYDAIGGHAAVKDRVDEDKSLAILVKRAGFRLLLADGRKLARTRMYTSLPEMWEGWTKNIYLGLADRLGLLLFGAFLGLVVSFLLPAWLMAGLAWLLGGGGSIAAIITAEAALLWGYLIWKRHQACRAFGIPGWYALTFPLGAFIFTLMMAASAYNVISGRGVTWKGRRYH